MNKIVLGLLASLGICSNAYALEVAGLKIQNDSSSAMTAPQLKAPSTPDTFNKAQLLLSRIRVAMSENDFLGDTTASDRPAAQIKSAMAELTVLLDANTEDLALQAYAFEVVCRELENDKHQLALTYVLAEEAGVLSKRPAYNEESRVRIVKDMISPLKRVKTLEQADAYMGLLYQFTRKCQPMTKRIAANLLTQVLKAGVSNLEIATHMKQTIDVIVL